MSKHDLKRRPSPLSGPGGRGIDPDVQKTIEHARKRWEKEPELKKVTIRLPANLVEDVKREAHRLTGHKRRGFQDFVAVLLRYGWNAYLDGELIVEMQPTVVQRRIVVASED